MRKIFTLMLPLLVFTTSACYENDEPGRACQINATINLSDGSKESLFLEETNERFVWNRIANEEEQGLFDFSFSNESSVYENSEEFFYVDSSNNKIEFNNECNYFSFKGSMTIYIYYNNSSSEIKSIVSSKIFNIVICEHHWFSDTSIY